MGAFLLLSRPQLRMDPIQSSSRTPTECGAGPDCDDLDFQDDPRPRGWIEVDHVSILGSSVCCRKPNLHNCGICDTVLHHQVRKYIADHVV